jgi:radical SAM protein with 4Fe4S-binding SPASM domain
MPGTPEPTPLPATLSVELTAACNQRCAHCYNAWRAEGNRSPERMETAELLALLDRVIAELGLGRVTLSGGEPLLHPDFRRIVEHLRERGLELFLITNGTLVDDEVARFLAPRFGAVQLTLAGADAAGHDEICGPGSFARVVAGLDALAAAGVATSGSFLCTSSAAPRAAATLARFVERGVRRVAFNRFNPSGFGLESALRLMPTRSQVLQALDQVEQLATREELEVSCTMPIPPCVVDEERYPHVGFGHCAAGGPESEPSLAPDGQLRLCPLQAAALGDLRGAAFREVWDAPARAAFARATPGFCRDCPHAATCRGGCGAAAEWAFGGAGELDPFVAQHVMEGYRARLRSPTRPASGGDDRDGPR